MIYNVILTRILLEKCSHITKIHTLFERHLDVQKPF